MTLSDCRIIHLPKIDNPLGSLTFIEGQQHVPFKIKRVYYLYDIPGGQTRAGHAHKTLQQLLVAITGSFDVLLDDGNGRERHHLNRSYYGLYIHPLTWCVIDNFSSGAVCLSIVSDYYSEADYYRDYAEFLRAVGGE